MTETAFQDWPTHSFLAQLRPEPGWRLDRACVASYSADVRVVTAALLALAGSATEPEMGSAMQFVQAIRNLRGRVAFVVQRGRIHRPRNLPRAAALLDRFLFEADCDERERSWHPKFAVMRWVRPEDQAVTWRAWVGSRNLTRDLSRDAGLLLAESADAGAGNALPGLRSAVAELQSHLPRSAGRFAQADLDTLARVRWLPPAGVSRICVDWLDGSESGFPRIASPQQQVIVVSPFVDANGMRECLKWVPRGTRPIVLSSDIELGRICAAQRELAEILDLRTCPVGVEEGTPYEQPTPQAEEDAGDGEQETDRSDEVSGYHAKLIYMRRGREKRLWMGSPNLTGRGWSRNFELAAELVSTAAKDPWTAVLREVADRANRFEPDEIPANAINKERDIVEDIRKLLCAELVCHQERCDGSVSLVATRWPALPGEEIQLFVGLPWRDCELIAWPWSQLELSLGEIGLGACSDFLLFVLCRGEEETGWLMHAPFEPPLDEKRDSVAMADYLGPDGYLALIRAELEPAKVSAPLWDAPGNKRGRYGPQQWHELGLPTLEGLLRLYLREPERLHAVAKTVTMLEKEAAKWSADGALPAQARADLAAFQKLWKEVGTFLIEQTYGART